MSPTFPGRAVGAVALDLLREAASRKWFLALGVGVSLGLLALAASLKLEVLDGALAASRFFGHVVSRDIVAVDVALRPVFEAAAYLIFYGGMAFGVVACADFGPSLLSPGRIEHLLSLPVRRWELLLGTFLGVLTLAAIAGLYGAGGLVVILGVKSGVWTLRPLASALLAGFSFAALYAAMLTTALFVRSAAASAAVGVGLFIAGVVASHRSEIAPVFQAGLGRELFRGATALLPRVSALANTGAAIASSQPVDWAQLSHLALGLVLFTAGALAVGLWRFEERDF